MFGLREVRYCNSNLWKIHDKQKAREQSIASEFWLGSPILYPQVTPSLVFCSFLFLTTPSVSSSLSSPLTLHFFFFFNSEKNLSHSFFSCCFPRLILFFCSEYSLFLLFFISLTLSLICFILSFYVRVCVIS